MYDPILNDTFDMDTHDTEWWDNGGEPMWVTVSKQGGRSATYFWAGGEAETNGGYRPDIWIPYNESHSYTARIDTVVKWFTEENIDFVALYFDEPDGAGHDYGHGSDEIDDMVKDLDILVGYLIDSFKSAGLYDIVDIIVTADHGMTDIFAAQKIYLEDYVLRSGVRDIGGQVRGRLSRIPVRNTWICIRFGKNLLEPI
ncbi:ectonucleotide pyrophosphatase/phosphodiesterase family member 7-like [Saccoglossus kowalevskii]|uniref:Ectonucleotide pyrophosphatase/phosphodiesterase family member 7-like n=1 Tax=Saccoglossus kowalevskii TaxID=10224 RepID=A0ABM0ML34_SACKO|nr:PREDICTED: ectonucleotide pyrophosphatase/phosphodiesterase family member 7-like [Saccoglossus kowalevskii]